MISKLLPTLLSHYIDGLRKKYGCHNDCFTNKGRRFASDVGLNEKSTFALNERYDGVFASYPNNCSTFLVNNLIAGFKQDWALGSGLPTKNLAMMMFLKRANLNLDGLFDNLANQN